MQQVENPTQQPPEPQMELVQPDGSLTDWFLSVCQSVLLTVWDAAADFLLWILDMVMAIGLTLLEGMTSVLQLTDITQYLTMMPPEVLNIIQLIGLPTCISMIAVAGGVRIIMQLIPFVRLGS